MTLQAGKECLHRCEMMTLEELAAQLQVDLVRPCLCSPKGEVGDLASHQQIQASASLVASTAKHGVILHNPK